MWQNTAEHSQQLAVGNFLKGVPGPQVVIGGRTYGNRSIGEPYLSSQLFWFDNKGELLKRYRDFAGDGVFRFSIGLEDAEDICADLDEVL